MVGTMRGSAASSQLCLGRSLLHRLPDPARGLESRGPDLWPRESYGTGQTRRHHTQNNAHCYRHGGGERYFPIVKGSLGWVEWGKSCKVAELRSSCRLRDTGGKGLVRAVSTPRRPPSTGAHASELLSRPRDLRPRGGII